MLVFVVVVDGGGFQWGVACTAYALGGDAVCAAENSVNMKLFIVGSFIFAANCTCAIFIAVCIGGNALLSN